ncbi:hypothetical protein F5890DRAFT_1494112 [Lentinula detonsa]|uniref:Uncharacterized protein n=1 Tax=Lentinula detonsa TaxID=2804962 RepID=A0AA38Q5X1_9AGAR|nr:hypothetical protein F5890DRAFT_1494112 [Lentinula detonsa]
MHFSFASCFVFGLAYAAYASPLYGLDKPQSRSTSDAVVPPQGSDLVHSFDGTIVSTRASILDARPRDNNPEPKTTISVTFPTTGSRKSFQVQNAIKSAVKSLLNAAKSKLGIAGEIQVVFTNWFSSPKMIPTEAEFTFSAKACQGRCTGTAKGPGKGVIHDAKNDVIFQAD